MDSASTYTKGKTALAWVVALTAIGSLMAALDTLVVSTALSTIRRDLGASVEQLEWTVNAYNLSWLADRGARGPGRRRRAGSDAGSRAHPPSCPERELAQSLMIPRARSLRAPYR
jgi:hypothetical protein